MQMSRLLAAAIAFSALAPSLQAADAPLPNPGEVKTLDGPPREGRAHRLRRRGAAGRHRDAHRRPARRPDPRREVRGRRRQGRDRARHRPRHAASQRHDRDHRDLRRQDGQGAARSRERCDENLPINFANQIVPIFTKLGCNCGGCHGKAQRPERLQACRCSASSRSSITRRS